MKGKNTAPLAALLGVCIGVLLMLVINKYTSTKKFDGDYDRWRKLNLILEQVEKKLRGGRSNLQQQW